MPIITIVDQEKSFEVPEGTNLRKALRKNGINPYVGKDRILNCRGNGLCGTCRVEIVEGKELPPVSALEEAALVGLTPLFARSIPKNVRLSCRINVKGDIKVKTQPDVKLDPQLTKERRTLLAIWLFFGGALLFVLVLLGLDLVKMI